MGLLKDNTLYLNLQEQVEKNKDDIEFLSNVGTALNQYGLKVIETFETEEEFEEWEETAHTHEYGDAVIIGSEEPYDMKVWTRASLSHTTDYWFDLGEFPLAGPKGEQGEKGEKGDTGARGLNAIFRVSDYAIPSAEEAKAANVGDVFLTTNGDAWIVESGPSGHTTDHIGNWKGPQGNTGATGATGAKGDKGDRGPQGEVGPTSAAYHIIGAVDTVNQLPQPTTLADLSAAYIVGNAKKLYLQVGETAETAVWTDFGSVAGGDCYWELSSNGTTLIPVEAVHKVECENVEITNLTTIGDETVIGGELKATSNAFINGDITINDTIYSDNDVGTGASIFMKPYIQLRNLKNGGEGAYAVYGLRNSSNTDQNTRIMFYRGGTSTSTYANMIELTSSCLSKGASTKIQMKSHTNSDYDGELNLGGKKIRIWTDLNMNAGREKFGVDSGGAYVLSPSGGGYPTRIYLYGELINQKNKFSTDVINNVQMEYNIKGTTGDGKAYNFWIEWDRTSDAGSADSKSLNDIFYGIIDSLDYCNGKDVGEEVILTHLKVRGKYNNKLIYAISVTHYRDEEAEAGYEDYFTFEIITMDGIYYPIFTIYDNEEAEPSNFLNMDGTATLDEVTIYLDEFSDSYTN